MFDYDKDCENVAPMVRGYKAKTILKMYPLEWMVKELEDDPVGFDDIKKTDILEPAWKIIVGNKALLPMLWEMFPNHPNLLPAYFVDPKVQLAKNAAPAQNEIEETWANEEKKKAPANNNSEFTKNYADLQITDWVSKPKFGREGEGVLFSKDFSSHEAFVAKTEAADVWKSTNR